METRLPHLVITDFEQKSFTGTGGGNVNPRPVRDRRIHSALLQQQLQQAWTEAENERVVYHSRRNGVYLEFKGEQGYELVTKSLEILRGADRENWTRLLNVRREKVQGEGETEVTEVVYATIYVPNSKKEQFFTRIEQYATEENTISGQPKNVKLLESISSIKTAARDKAHGHPGTASAADYWVLGQARDKGSIHSDIWQGYASDLALSNLIAIYPTIGWWRERPHLNKWNRTTRYALLVSITTPEQKIDIYTPVANQIGIAVPTEIKV